MRKMLAFLTFTAEDWSNGFKLMLEIKEDKKNTSLIGRREGYLPANPELEEKTIAHWETYRSLADPSSPYRELRSPRLSTGHIHPFERCKDSAEKLKEDFNKWLKSSDSFRDIREFWMRHIKSEDEVRFLIQTDDPQLKKLPWHDWNFLEEYNYTEVGFSFNRFESDTNKISSLKSKVRILAIFGSKEGINIESDRKILQQLQSKADICFLIEPEPNEINEKLWKQDWDIIFFAGHGRTEGEKGILHLNDRVSLPISDLEYGLKKVVEKGLQLAIFNSCDGMGLAKQLDDVLIPQMIIMRERVPDRVAQIFLKYFIEAFSGGKSLYLAVKEARQQLRSLEEQEKCPCASWLPVIYQNPAEVPKLWKDLTIQPTSWKFILANVLLASVVVTNFVIFVASLGLLQSAELNIFDLFTRFRSPEPIDSRFLIITVDEADRQYQEKRFKDLKFSLSDRAFIQLVDKLLPLSPQLIVSDIERPSGFNPQLTQKLRNNDFKNRFLHVCKIAHPKDKIVGVPPPSGIPTENLGFSNWPLDPDKFVRRQLFGMREGKDCQTNISLSYNIAYQYLQKSGNLQKLGEAKPTPEGDWKIGNVLFPKMPHDAGGYQLNPLAAQGYQILLNYRSVSSEFKNVPLREILSGLRDTELPNLVKNRIVLLGVVDPNQDSHLTPYGEQPGVFIHAQMASQIISAVLDDRPLLRWWPQAIETIWAWGWSFVGGVLICRVQSRFVQGIVMLTAIGSLGAVSFILFSQGIWVPLMPSALTLVFTSSSIFIYTKLKFPVSH
jgi:CHASE2 domain-containing sensor protein